MIEFCLVLDADIKSGKGEENEKKKCDEFSGNIVTGNLFPSHEVFPSHVIVTGNCFPVTITGGKLFPSHEVSQSRCFPVTKFPSHDSARFPVTIRPKQP